MAEHFPVLSLDMTWMSFSSCQNYFINICILLELPEFISFMSSSVALLILFVSNLLWLGLKTLEFLHIFCCVVDVLLNLLNSQLSITLCIQLQLYKSYELYLF